MCLISAGKLSCYFQAVLPVNAVMSGEMRTLLEEPFELVAAINCC